MICIIMREAKDFYRLLSIFCFLLSGFILIRKMLLVEFSLIPLLTGLFWAIIGFIIALKFLNMDGYAMTVQEGMFYVFILYCSFYFLLDLLYNLLFLSVSMDMAITTLNLMITTIGWLGILAYIYY